MFDLIPRLPEWFLVIGFLLLFFSIMAWIQGASWKEISNSWLKLLGYAIGLVLLVSLLWAVF